jgi:threonine dehydratase
MTFDTSRIPNTEYPIPNPTLRDIYLARQRIAPLVRRTPLIASPALTERVGAPVHLKLENLQETGSFKIRGAANKLLSLAPEEKKRGVIAVSTGNHGRAVAHMARRLGLKAVICLSGAVPRNKIEALQRLGAEVVVYGDSYDAAAEHALQLQQAQRLTMIHPFDDPWVIAGQGTIGLELLEELPELDTAVVPLSGGGLMGGIALALKSAHPGVRVIGVSMARAPVMYHSLRAGRPIEMEEEETLADALAGGIGLDNQYTFRLVQAYVDETLLVSEEEIAAAMAFALQEHHLVVEGGGAVGIAALLHNRAEELGQNVAVVVSGGNANIPLLVEIAQGKYRP